MNINSSSIIDSNKDLTSVLSEPKDKQQLNEKDYQDLLNERNDLLKSIKHKMMK